MKSYQEKLKDPRWQKKRLRALEKAKWTCQNCGDKKSTLHIHHLKYKSNPWESPYKDLKVLCSICHKMENEKKEVKYILKEIIDKEYMQSYYNKWECICDFNYEYKRFIWNVFAQIMQRDKDQKTSAILKNHVEEVIDSICKKLKIRVVRKNG